MRILLVNKFAHVTGGADRHCLELAELLRGRGHEVTFLSTASPANVESRGVFIEPSVTARTRDGLSTPGRAAAAAKAFWNPEATAAMRNLLRRFRPDVVHAHKLYPQLSVAPIVIAARAGVRVVQTLHDYELVSASATDARGGRVDHDEARAEYRALTTSLLPVRRLIHAPRIDAYVSVSRLVSRVYRSHGIESTVIPNFIRNIDDAAERRGFDDRKGIVYVGRLTEEKGIRDVVGLARALPSIPVTIVGSGPLEGEIQASAAALPNLEVLGFLSPAELPNVLRRARLAVVPSRWQEPGPLVPLEAMAVGTPVIAYANGGLAEYVGDIGGGEVVPADLEMLSRVCCKIIGDEALWSTLSAQALNGVSHRHDPSSYADQLEKIYTKPAESSSRGSGRS